MSRYRPFKETIHSERLYSSYIDPTKVWHVYQIVTNSGQSYVGITTNVKRRVQDHQNNECKTTANRGEWVLHTSICVGDAIIALQIETLAKVSNHDLNWCAIHYNPSHISGLIEYIRNKRQARQPV